MKKKNSLIVILYNSLLLIASGSYLAEKEPEVLIPEALKLAEFCLEKNISDSSDYYVIQAFCAYHDYDEKSRTWKIAYAKPGGFFRFVAVYMDKSSYMLEAKKGVFSIVQ